MPFSTTVLPWWAWLLSALILALFSAIAASMASMDAERRPGGCGCQIVTGLLILATLVTGGISVLRFVKWMWG